MTFDEFDLKRIFNALDFAANKHWNALKKMDKKLRVIV